MAEQWWSSPSSRSEGAVAAKSRPARCRAGGGIWWTRATGSYCWIVMGDGFCSPSVVARVGGVLHVSGDSKRSPESPTCLGVSRFPPKSNTEKQRSGARMENSLVCLIVQRLDGNKRVRVAIFEERSHMFRSCEPSWWRRCSGWAGTQQARANHSSRSHTPIVIGAAMAEARAKTSSPSGKCSGERV